MDPGPMQERLAPLAAERRDVGGEGHHGGLDAVERVQPQRGNLEHLAQFREPSAARGQRLLGRGGIAHQPDQDLGARFVGDHVGRAPAGDGADVQRARPQQRIDRQRDAPHVRPARRSACGWPNRPAPG